MHIVPIYSFGENELYYQSETITNFLKPINSLKFFWISLFWGKYYTLYPLNKDLLYAIGKPIKVTKIEKPTQTDINLLHEKFCKELTILFDKHKEKAGFPDKELLIN